MSSHLPGNAPQSQCSVHLSTSGNNCRFGGCWRYIHTGWYTHRQMAGSDLNKWPYQQPLPLATFWSTFRRCLWLSTHQHKYPTIPSPIPLTQSLLSSGEMAWGTKEHVVYCLLIGDHSDSEEWGQSWLTTSDEASASERVLSCGLSNEHAP